MSARLDPVPRFRRMTASDVDYVTAVEARVYPYPWTRGNFVDSLEAGYHCWIVECAGAIAGYMVVAVAAGEAHLLNLSIDVPWQRQGLGTALLRFAVKLAADCGAEKMFLEVRPSNTAARALYRSAGFREIGVRRAYYPQGEGREDALVLELEL